MSNLTSRIKRYPRNLIKDERGWFLKAITGLEENMTNHVGEVYFSSATPGQTKGKHYHLKAMEWFTLISGKAVLMLEDIDTKEKMQIELDGNTPETVFIPQRVAHSIENRFDSDFILCAYTDLQYDSSDTITYDI